MKFLFHNENKPLKNYYIKERCCDEDFNVVEMSQIKRFNLQKLLRIEINMILENLMAHLGRK